MSNCGMREELDVWRRRRRRKSRRKGRRWRRTWIVSTIVSANVPATTATGISTTIPTTGVPTWGMAGEASVEKYVVDECKWGERK